MGSIYAAFFPDGLREYYIIGIFTLLSFIYMLFGLNSSYKSIKVVLKCGPLIFLLTYMVYSASKVNVGPMHGTGDIEDMRRILFGLLFSLLGDFYLVFDSLFILGILAFASAQIIYINLFGGWIWNIPVISYGMEYGDILSAIAISLVSIAVYLYIWKKLSWVLVIPTGMYCLLLSSMLWCAWMNAQHEPSTATFLGAAGAGLFYISDLVLVIGKWRLEIPYGKHIVIITYYASQILITLHVIRKFL